MIDTARWIGGPRLSFGIAGVLFAFAALLALPSIAQAAGCFASAAAVRKADPNGWPKWTYSPTGERCWYSGEKPVFARAPLQLVPQRRAPPTQTPVMTEAVAKSDDPAPQPWALEHRWAEIFRYAAPPTR